MPVESEERFEPGGYDLHVEVDRTVLRLFVRVAQVGRKDAYKTQAVSFVRGDADAMEAALVEAEEEPPARRSAASGEGTKRPGLPAVGPCPWACIGPLPSDEPATEVQTRPCGSPSPGGRGESRRMSWVPRFPSGQFCNRDRLRQRSPF